MPSHHRFPKAAARGMPAAGPAPRAGHGAWSAQLAASPAQRRQAAQLQALFGPRGAAVVQGQFTAPDGKLIHDPETAGELARAVEQQSPASTSAHQRELFEQALVELATDGQDHGQLDAAYLQDLLARGRVREAFALEHQPRRLHTRLGHEAPNFPPERSHTARKLAEIAQRPGRSGKGKRKKTGGDDGGAETEAGDFTYRDLRAILDASGIDALPPERLEAATRQAVGDWQAETVGFSPDLPVDVQLVVQHLLHYQRFNSPPLAGRYKKPENEPEDKRREREADNLSRQHELDKSKRLLVADARHHFVHTLPPDPVEGHVDYAFSGLVDVNRPQPDGPLQGAAYKAVYLCVKKVLRASWERARAARPGAGGAELDRQQRLRFNRALAELLPDFEGSTLRDRAAGVRYVRDTIGLSRFSDREELSDEDSSSSDEEEELPSSASRAILDETADVEANEGRIKLWSATIGTLSKLSLQKQLIDQATLDGELRDDAEHKHQRRRRKIERHVGRVSRRHKQHFKIAQSELHYLSEKRAALEGMIQDLTARLRKTSDPGMRELLKQRRFRLRELLDGLNDFYAGTSVAALTALAARSRQWKRSHDVLRHLGKKGLEAYATQDEPEPDTEEEEEEEEEQQEEKEKENAPRGRKRRKLAPASGKADPEGKGKARK